ncbi:serine/threonine protein kinase [Actinokineospora iranica]|uniref:non-specific serine/threonine protein kinase n=1 Tax=Actinokineospora iranica TaxID=1271860 RepID=A0A1G6XPE3_9PSEU|nr:serine/threonine-protein kinase [Actinokineospora iranica]SDD80020.1 Serine/threonine protein kinase [Actinokineospora iranica]
MTTPGDVVGGGPVATVYSGQRDGVPVALKVFPRVFDRRTRTAFERERAALRGAPSLLPVDGVEARDGKQILRMELCARSLADLVGRAGPLPARDVVSLGRALATALVAAHRAGVVHGGVTPHNVLFRATGEPLLSDAGPTLRQAFPRDPLHAIEFRSPEAIRTDAPGERDDLYALGAVLHFALTGGSPHPGRLGERAGDRVLRVLREPVPAVNRPGVPVELSTVVARLLAVDPAHRPQSADAVATRMAEIAALIAPPPTTPAPLATPVTGRTPVAAFDFRAAAPDRPKSRRAARRAAIGLSVTAAAAAVVMLTRTPSSELSTEPAAAPASTVDPSRPVSTPGSPTTRPSTSVELDDPSEEGGKARLTWRGSTPLDYMVKVMPEGEKPWFLPAGRNSTILVDVEPDRKYCFQVRAANPTDTVQSPAKPFRGAVCA